MRFRLAHEGDIPALLRIGHDFFEFNPFKDSTTLVEEDLALSLRAMMTEPHILIVGEVDGKVVATACAAVSPMFWNHSFLHAQELFWWVDPEHRGGGAGAKLKEALEHSMRAEGVHFSCMVAMETSMPAEVTRMYEASGYKKTETTFVKALIP